MHLSKANDQILGHLKSRVQLSPLTSHAYLDIPNAVFFLIDEAEHAGKGAMVVCSLVHAYFHLYGLGERSVTLQADNCTGQNKTTTLLWYLAWRVITGLHDRIQLNLMLPGRTTFRPDSYFGLFKTTTDHTDDMADLVKCVRKSGQDVECMHATALPGMGVLELERLLGPVV
eukprot:Em0002g837a